MAITRAEKEQTLKRLEQDLATAKGVVFTQYRGMTVKQVDNLRRTLRKENVKYQVVKVTLIKKALAALGLNAENFKYHGPVALAVSENEESAPARILKNLSKDNPQLVFESGILNHELIGADVVERLACLPTKEQLLGQLLSVLQGPSRGLVTVLSGNLRGLVNVLNAIKEKKV